MTVRVTTAALPQLDPVTSARARWRQLWLLTLLFLFSVASYLVVSRFLVTAVIVQGRSMHPTLQDGERYFMDRWTLQRRAPQRGDLVVLRDPGHNDYAVKRIVATPGETVRLKDGAVLINDAKLIEPYLPTGVRTYTDNAREQIFMLGGNHYFVLGDNRPISEDSRAYGPVQRDRIIGLIAQ